MNWLRDNILKILIILGVVIVITVVVVILFSKPKETPTVSGSKYGEIETKMKNAAIQYVNSHKKLLPSSTEELTKVSLKTLQSNNYIGKLVSVDDSKVTCDGYVEISKLESDNNLYVYTPFISCGEYYVTKTIGDYIIDEETNNGSFERTADEGLYKIGDEYVFRGEKVNNFIKLDNHLFRIIKIDSNKSLELISVTPTEGSYVWDDKYNIDTKKSTGINDFSKSRLKETLDKLYYGSFFSDTERSYIVKHDFCIGKRNSKDYDKNSGVECKETTPLRVGLLSFGEYARASVDPYCINAYDKSCINYNYFEFLNGSAGSYYYTTLTALSDNSSQFYAINDASVSAVRTSSSSVLYPVIYINKKTIYSTGSGTRSDPFVVR